MKWGKEAEELSPVFLFLSEESEEAVEEEATRCGAKEVDIEHVKTCRNVSEPHEDEVKGYQ